MYNFKDSLSKHKEYGIVESVEHPIIKVNGLPGAKVDELVVFEGDQIGHVNALKHHFVEIITYSKTPIIPGSRVARTDTSLSIPISNDLLGKVINPLAQPLFKYENFKLENPEYREIDIAPPKLDTRVRIERQLETGVTLVDSIIPLGRGQRELVVGDRKTGKTSTILSIMKTQILLGSIVIYAAIGKEKADTKRLKEYLEKNDLINSAIIVSTAPDDPPSTIDLTPYSAATLAEYFRDAGKDVLLILDDLTTHAKFYREMTLLARKFPGRDSYPGDIFYKHARLLERAGNFKTDQNKIGESSITALVLAETINTSLTDYIVSNLISITDGHIHFDSELFNRGLRPAIDIFLSVTRVGKQTQNPIARKLTRDLMQLMARHERSSNFKHFGAELTEEIKQLLAKGDQIYAFFDQSYQRSMPLNVQTVFLALILKDKIIGTTPNDVKKMKKNLYQQYKQKETKDYIDKLMQAKQFEDFVAIIEKESASIIKLCQDQQG